MIVSLDNLFFFKKSEASKTIPSKKYVSVKIQRSTGLLLNLIPCSCGCDQLIPKYDNSGRERKFAFNHKNKKLHQVSLIKCACGCGGMRTKFRKGNELRNFINGHQYRVQHDKIKIRAALRLMEKSEMILCVCGCNEKIHKFDKKGRICKFKLGHNGKFTVISEEGKKRLKEFHTGRKQSLEAIEKSRIAHLGLPSAMKGKTHSEATKKIIREKRLLQIIPKRDSKPEKMMQVALSLQGIKYEKHKALLGQPDIFIEPNTCIFVDGDFFHANPEEYSADDYMLEGKYAKDIWEKDLRVNHWLSTKGYHVIRIWESDIINNVKEISDNIMNMIAQINKKEVIKN